mmetsp:Transcript_31805/g.77512  ORF Transcript_31805/g.77512 Transcript_31805/m.77512 type:complete len:941 (-) Transcript_31805:66-2888(-)|eukprot:CAMPEP_0114493070 /NCGR_PEP_ID=MMETSP0109-20121206/3909_1 /TAXON_ID=29199 /ORGANISM="Chlorarachnion reptans, Strain CCCM449" /LENGTH=940 /DNA_ID=CAMNT_0001669989 /DNA_START=107 /DNA_END=2929 /DNA_ORIENTATION=-
MLFRWLLALLSAVHVAAGGHLSQSPSRIAVEGVQDNSTILVSTVDGHLHAISLKTGAKLWQLKSSPLVSSNLEPLSDDGSPTNYRIIAGIDGQLYKLNEEGMKRLPKSIKQLASAPPLKSPDARYMIRKTDSVLMINRNTGTVQGIVSFDEKFDQGECSSEDDDSSLVWVAKTEFTILALNDRGKSQWNVSFGEYSSFSFNGALESIGMNKGTTPPEDVDVVSLPRIGVSISGDCYCFTKENGQSRPLWGPIELGSPVAAVHLMSKGNDIHKVPHVYLHQINEETLNLVELQSQHEVVFVGQTGEGGFYALSPDKFEDMNAMNQNLLPEVADHSNGASRAVAPFGYEAKQLARISGSNMLPPNDAGLRGFFILPKKAPYLILPPEELSPNVWKMAKLKNLIVYSLALLGGAFPILYSYLRKIRQNSLREGRLTEEGKAKNNDTKKKPRKKHHIHLGKMRIYTQQVLGKGSGGTVVYVGQWDGREVAVKRLLKDTVAIDNDEETKMFQKDATNVEKEIQLLISSDHLPNIVRYYAKEEDGDFVYLALEKCEMTLHQYVTNKRIWSVEGGRNAVDGKLLQTVKGVISGVRQLHDLNVVHRDLKPRNILLDKKNRPKIGDMGLGKKLSKHRSSFETRVCGSVGWQPPEMISIRFDDKSLDPEYDSPKCPQKSGIDADDTNTSSFGSSRLTKSVDVFSAGCIIYYVLTHGKHPFGPEPDREHNIIRNKSDLSGLDHFPLAQELVKSMIAHSPGDRITANDAENHPLFWENDKKLAFLQDVSDRVVRTNSYALCCLMEADSKSIVGNGWDRKLHEELLSDLGKYRKYNFSSVCDCLRVIRNKKNHYLELTAGAKRVLGSLPNGFLKYFSERFPRLLIHSYITMCSFYVSRSGMDDDQNFTPESIDFETFARYFSGLSMRRLLNLRDQNRMRPCRGWWPRSELWAQ